MAKLSTEEKKLLIELVQPVHKRLQFAWLLSFFATLLLVLQAWVLATILAHQLQLATSGLTFTTETFWQWWWLLLLCFLLRPMLILCRELIGNKASIAVRSQLRQRLLIALAHLGMERQAFGSDGSLSSQVIEQTDALDAYISRFIVQKKIVATTPLILLIACAWQSLTVASILLLTAPFVPILMIIIGKMTAKKSAQQFSALAQLSGRFLDWVRGMTTLKRLQATAIAEVDLYNASEDYRKRTMAVLKIAFLNGAVLEFLSALSIALVAIYLGLSLLGELPWQSIHTTNNVDYFGALFILLLVPEFYAPLRQLGMDYHAQAQAQGAVQSLLPLLKRADELKSLHNAHNNQETLTLNYQHALAIKLKDVVIQQHIISKQSKISEQNSPIQTITRTRLAATSFSIEANERVGLIGESGSGKSSVLQALLGFSNYKGDIIISDDSQSLNHRYIDINELRQNVGYLAQQVALLPLSIADNLRLAKPTASDAELIKVLQDVAMYELVQQLPSGMDTELGERGRGLSGGQQQRLGIAQLLLRESNTWLLDEPTEHLDSDTEEQLHNLLEKVSRNKTVIWITHAVERLPWLDKVIEITI